MDLVKSALEIMWKGMLAVFIVALVIIIFVWALNFFTSGRIKKTIADIKAKNRNKNNKNNTNS